MISISPLSSSISNSTAIFLLSSSFSISSRILCSLPVSSSRAWARSSFPVSIDALWEDSAVTWSLMGCCEKMLVRWLSEARILGMQKQQITLCRHQFLFYLMMVRFSRHSSSTRAISRQRSRLSTLLSSSPNSSLFSKLDSIRNLLNQFSRQDLSLERLSCVSSSKQSSQTCRSCFLSVTANSQMMYLRYLESLQSLRSTLAMLVVVGLMFISLKLLFRMQSTPRIRQMIVSTMNRFYSVYCLRICQRRTASSLLANSPSFYEDFTSVGRLSLAFSPVITESESRLLDLQGTMDSWKCFKGSRKAYPTFQISISSSESFMSLKGSVVSMNCLNSARETLVLWFRSIIFCRNFKKFSSLKEDEPRFFMSTEMGFCVASFKMARYSLQLEVFFFRQGWWAKITSQRHTPREQMSLFSLGRNRRDLSFSGGMQEMVPFLVVVSLHSPISDTPKSQILNRLPFFRMFAGLISSCTMPASRRVINPLHSWKNKLQISSSERCPSPLLARYWMSVPDSQYSWKMQRLFSDSKCSLWILTRLGQSGRFLMMFNSFRYSLLIYSESILMTLTANSLLGTAVLCALKTLAYRPYPMRLRRTYLSSVPVSSLRRVTILCISYIKYKNLNNVIELRKLQLPPFKHICNHH